MTDLRYLSVSEASRLIRTRALSPLEYTTALLERISAVDAIYNAFLLVTAESALAEAKAAETEIAAGRWRGPLHGIPYAVKDIFDVAGLPTTCHSKIRTNHRAATDAFVIGQLRAAGAVMLGKTALHEFATGGPAFDLPWPPARNPWNPKLHPGGSSSGSGVALAAGMAPMALGTDTGGSVRNPATCCGVIGMKPTYGRVSRAGVFPLAFSLDHVGTMTRSVEDNAMLLQAIAGHDPDDPTSIADPLPDLSDSLRNGLKGLRIGVIEHFYTEDAEADAEQLNAITSAIAVMRGLGAEISAVRVAPLNVWTDCNRTIHQAESYAIHEQYLQERPQDYAAITRKKILPGAFISSTKYIRAQQLRTALCREMAEATRSLDAVVTLSSLDLPASIEDADAVARTYERQCRLVFNVTGTPTISVPTGFTSSGLPLAMQIAGHALDEATVYRVAYAYCEATGFAERRPPIVVPEQAVHAAE
jgi:aspartyl-tRNA(Asn)/glutamyl-tRNA(Gln) amidotransferase subunit A